MKEFHELCDLNKLLNSISLLKCIINYSYKGHLWLYSGKL